MTAEQAEELVIPENLAGPFLRERIVQGRGFRHAGAQVASVVYYQDGGHSVITARGADHGDRLGRWSRPSTVCEVACGRHTTSFALKLPAHGSATFFETRVKLRWEVTDYRLVVEKRLFSVEEDLGPEIVDRLQGVSTRYSVDQAHEANQAVRLDIEAGRWADLGQEVGLRTKVFVEVGTDRTQIGFVVQTRKDDAEAQRVARRFRGFAAIAQGSDTEKYAYLMASGTGAEVGRLVKMMMESQAEEQRSNREFLVRMAHEGRLNTPELDAYLRRTALRGPAAEQSAIPADPPRAALPPSPVTHTAESGSGASGRDWPDTPAPGPAPAGRAPAEPVRTPPEEDDWWGEPQDTAAHLPAAPAGPDDGYGPPAHTRHDDDPRAGRSGAGSRSWDDEDDDIWSGPVDGGRGGGR
ncbi:alanine and proline-rich secreted protein Apa [Streptomyces sp. J2-1]|uniref:alanine and proline-rich secreted protein Apa n=1 Tax=Streptomyces corallincola TaxID=2851888 RepID=UPI001C3837E3|nr:alanine and proline-rich secreted protein Apa [Streptomyces corallincola]MBV2355265.1 alanine and proline-rich secreted protein Apa [Streptomyces corallincola]